MEKPILNITPTFLVVPAALEATAYQIINSIADPSVGGDTTGSSGVANIYGPSGARNLTVVVDPLLDGNSTTKWYLAAQNSMVDTVELSFLSGENTPVLENEYDMCNDSYYSKSDNIRLRGHRPQRPISQHWCLIKRPFGRSNSKGSQTCFNKSKLL